MEEEDICRFCRSEATAEQPLFHPCLCTGSIKYIHQECLVQWLNTSKKTECELCNHKFMFRPIYAPDTPTTLPRSELLWALLKHAGNLVLRVLRLILVALCWLVVMPFSVTRMWAIFFSPSGRFTDFEWNTFNLSMMCAEGMIIAASVLFIFLGLIALNNYIVTNIPDEEEDLALQEWQRRQVRQNRRRIRRQRERRRREERETVERVRSGPNTRPSLPATPRASLTASSRTATLGATRPAARDPTNAMRRPLARRASADSSQSSSSNIYATRNQAKEKYPVLGGAKYTAEPRKEMHPSGVRDINRPVAWGERKWTEEAAKEKHPSALQTETETPTKLGAIELPEESGGEKNPGSPRDDWGKKQKDRNADRPAYVNRLDKLTPEQRATYDKVQRTLSERNREAQRKDKEELAQLKSPDALQRASPYKPEGFPGSPLSVGSAERLAKINQIYNLNANLSPYSGPQSGTSSPKTKLRSQYSFEEQEYRKSPITKAPLMSQFSFEHRNFRKTSMPSLSARDPSPIADNGSITQDGSTTKDWAGDDECKSKPSQSLTTNLSTSRDNSDQTNVRGHAAADVKATKDADTGREPNTTASTPTHTTSEARTNGLASPVKAGTEESGKFMAWLEEKGRSADGTTSHSNTTPVHNTTTDGTPQTDTLSIAHHPLHTTNPPPPLRGSESKSGDQDKEVNKSEDTSTSPKSASDSFEALGRSWSDTLGVSVWGDEPTSDSKDTQDQDSRAETKPEIGFGIGRPTDAFRSNNTGHRFSGLGRFEHSEEKEREYTAAIASVMAERKLNQRLPNPAMDYNSRRRLMDRGVVLSNKQSSGSSDPNTPGHARGDMMGRGLLGSYTPPPPTYDQIMARDSLTSASATTNHTMTRDNRLPPTLRSHSFAANSAAVDGWRGYNSRAHIPSEMNGAPNADRISNMRLPSRTTAPDDSDTSSSSFGRHGSGASLSAGDRAGNRSSRPDYRAGQEPRTGLTPTTNTALSEGEVSNDTASDGSDGEAVAPNADNALGFDFGMMDNGAENDNGEGGFGLAGLFDGPHEDASFEELIGLSGPMTNLLENLFWVLLFLSAFVCLLGYLPCVFGFYLIRFGHLMSEYSGDVVRMMGASIIGIETDVLVTNSTFGNLTNETLSAFTKEGAIHLTDNLTASVIHTVTTSANTTANMTEKLLHAHPLNLEALVLKGAPNETISNTSGDSTLYDYLPIFYGLVGYIGLASFASFLLYITESRDFPTHATPTNRSAARFLRKTFIFFVSLVKVCGLVLTELGVFPLLCGWWLDICALPLVSATLTSRIQYAQANHATAAFLHWIAGMLYMSHFAAFVGVVRDEVRPGVLWFLRNPNDPGFQPVKEMIELPVHHHVRRIVTSAVMYGLVVLWLVYVPVSLACALGIYPANVRLDEPLSDVSVDLVLFHMVLPWSVEKLYPADDGKALVRRWLTWMGEKMGVVEYLLVQEDEGVPVEPTVADANVVPEPETETETETAGDRETATVLEASAPDAAPAPHSVDSERDNLEGSVEDAEVSSSGPSSEDNKGMQIIGSMRGGLATDTGKEPMSVSNSRSEERAENRTESPDRPDDLNGGFVLGSGSKGKEEVNCRTSESAEPTEELHLEKAALSESSTPSQSNASPYTERRKLPMPIIGDPADTSAYRRQAIARSVSNYKYRRANMQSRSHTPNTSQIDTPTKSNSPTEQRSTDSGSEKAGYEDSELASLVTGLVLSRTVSAYNGGISKTQTQTSTTTPLAHNTQTTIQTQSQSQSPAPTQEQTQGSTGDTLLSTRSMHSDETEFGTDTNSSALETPANGPTLQPHTRDNTQPANGEAVPPVDRVVLPENNPNPTPTPQLTDVADAVDVGKTIKHFRLKMLGFVTLIFLSLFACNLTLAIVPVSVGRAVTTLVIGRTIHDLYSLAVGIYVLWGIKVAVRGVLSAVNRVADLIVGNEQSEESQQHLVSTVGMISKAFGLVMWYIIVIPFLAGLVSELLFIIPMTVADNESIIFHPFQTWAGGVVLTKVAHKLLMLGPVNSWQDTFLILAATPYDELDTTHLHQTITRPIVEVLLLSLLVPYVASKGFFAFFCSSPDLINFAFRYAHISCLVAVLGYQFVGLMQEWVSTVHDDVKKKKYLIDLTLLNIDDKSGNKGVAHTAHLHTD